ncbi:MAG: hypothetical protein LBD55_05905 [Treponema sp.]|nr:hypothetical protein [Treponema sp.]
MKHRMKHICRFLPVVSFVIFALPLSCSNHTVSKQKPARFVSPPPQAAPAAGQVPSPQPPPQAATPEAISAPSLGMPPLAIIKSGDNPLWFELGPEKAGTQGPFLINNPDEASLIPFEPWPLARFITGMVIQEDRLIMGMNREGFLIAMPWKDGGIALYRITDAAYWGNYTIGSLFLFEGNPAALLYRNVFFVDPLADPPAPRFFTPDKGNIRPVGIGIPAFEAFHPSAGWDIEALRQGQDGYWYYRGTQRPSMESPHNSVYFRTSDLSLPGEAVSVSAFRNSALPISPDKAPPLLNRVLDKAFGLSGRNRTPVAAVISPQFPYTRYFAAAAALSSEGERLIELSGYYLNTGGGNARALVILPDGRGMSGETQGDTSGLQAFTLPALPEGFVYTRVGSSGNTVIAAWEEQQDLNVGAAGLMILRSPFP